MQINDHKASITSLPGIKHKKGPTWPPPAEPSRDTQWSPQEVLQPEEYFVKYSVSEVRQILKRLRSDADKKQEELRLMVGESYRDLLQASTSIMSMADSSDRVKRSIAEMRITVSEEHPATHARGTHRMDTPEDEYLRTMQSLAAHLKLLLDTSEHLWRLLEQKRYLHAAWLFLLSRVVYLSLTREADGDDEGWDAKGVNVLEEFPLAQRQWEAVSQFRSQIIHKATLSLREHEISPEDTCTSLLSLHLLDSVPITDTLSMLLKQRLRSLTTPVVGLPSGEKVTKVPNGKPADRSRRKTIQNTWETSQRAIRVVIWTLSACRHIYARTSSGPSMIEQALLFVHDESKATSLTPNLRFNTSSLISSLPSFTHFQYLPPNVQAYKPYVDVDSPSSIVPQDLLTEKLKSWFKESSIPLKAIIHSSLDEINSVQDIWELRALSLDLLRTSNGLIDDELSTLRTLIEGACYARAQLIWKAALHSLEETFHKTVQQLYQIVREDDSRSELDINPPSYLFMPLPPASVPTPSVNGSLSIFEKHKDVLEDRIEGKTPLIRNLSDSLEQKTRQLQQDMDLFLKECDNPNQASYYNDAEAALSSIYRSVEKLQHAKSPKIQELMFINRVGQIVASSSFLSSLECRQASVAEFLEKLDKLRRTTLHDWITQVLHTAVDQYKSDMLSLHHVTPSIYSSPIFAALISISESLRSWMLIRDIHERLSMAEECLKSLVGELCDIIDEGHLTGRQVKLDLVVLQSTLKQWGPSLSQECHHIQDVIHRLGESSTGETAERSSNIQVAQRISESRILLYPLLPPGGMEGLPTTISDSTSPQKARHGITASKSSRSAESDFHTPMQLAKPPPRFTLLLAGNPVIR